MAMNGGVAGQAFDYEDERTIEGRGEVRVGTHDLAALRLERILDDLPDRDSTVLEIGCGAGRHTRAIKHYRPRCRVYGCDLSERAIEEARQAGQDVEYRVGDALDLPYPEEFFDTVAILDVLEHVDDPLAALSEVWRVLKPGGRLLAYVPLEGNPGTLYRLLRRSRTLPILRWKRDLVGHVQQFAEADVLSLLAVNGFQVVRSSYSFHVAGQMHDVIDYWTRHILLKPAGRLDRLLVRLASKPAFVLLWRLSYWEDMLRRRDPVAAGMHITAVKG